MYSILEALTVAATTATFADHIGVIEGAVLSIGGEEGVFVITIVAVDDSFVYFRTGGKAYRLAPDVLAEAILDA